MAITGWVKEVLEFWWLQKTRGGWDNKDSESKDSVLFDNKVIDPQSWTQNRLKNAMSAQQVFDKYLDNYKEFLNPFNHFHLPWVLCAAISL